ncbi:MAG: hypothetical protein OEQ53_19180 [Saprospiraceae bacterium]|nr:hypothetical protein [Saprospiraceae bacterium]
MSFRNFEDLYLQHKSHTAPNRWLGRIDNLFNDLDVEDDEKYDARIPQLKNICGRSILLFDALTQLDEHPPESEHRDKLLAEMRKFIDQ